MSKRTGGSAASGLTILLGWIMIATMRPLGNEETVYLSVLSGCIEIHADGSVWKILQRRKDWRSGKVTFWPVPPHRIDGTKIECYRFVKVMVDGKQVSSLAHRLVFRHFNGSIPDGLTINHINGKKGDNRPSNLELATYAEQTKHAREVLEVGRLDQDGKENSMAKLTNVEIVEIRRMRSEGMKLKDIASRFAVSYQNVSKIARRERWKHI